MTIPPEIIDILAKTKTRGSLAVLPKLPDRKTYVRVNAVLEALGGKWNKSAQAHQFPGDAGDAIASAINSGSAVDAAKERKKAIQFFETPEALADRMVKIADIKESDWVLEPSAGAGSIISAVLRAHPEKRGINAIEIDAENIKALMQFRGKCNTTQGDFLKIRILSDFHKILMNPPFRNGQDTAHVRRAYDVLKAGGRLVAITSHSWTFRDDKRHREFRQFIEGLGASVRIEELPAGTFRESGTEVRTMLLVIDKQS